jgi:hypothetical protein
MGFRAERWRYRLETPRMGLVVAFPSDNQVDVITGWRRRA